MTHEPMPDGAVEAALTSTHIIITSTVYTHKFPNGDVNDNYPIDDEGWWGQFKRCLDGRWRGVREAREREANTYDNDDADGQTRLVTDGGLAPENDPEEYEPGDGRQDNGLECCARCSRSFSANGGYTGAVYDRGGRRYEHLTDSDPEDGPFFCESCWNEMENARKRVEHATLEQFENGGEQA